MNYNEVMELAQKEAAKRHIRPVPTAKDIKQAELAMNVMGHPAWDAFHIHLQELAQDATNTLAEIKDRWATALQVSPVLHEQALAHQARINTLKEIMDYLPTLVKKVQ